MEETIAEALPSDDLAEFDRVCRRQGVTRLDAVQEALRWYIERDGDLPTIDYGDEPDLA
jgi:metal-responsive CopG/Arc/MetJ family transcriptional regulator